METINENKIITYSGSNLEDIRDPEFAGLMSSDEIWYAGEVDIRLTDVIDEKVDANHTHSGYATIDHSHSDYASQTDLETLEDVVDTKANATHTHTGYASSTHSHNNYATVTALDTLESELYDKANVNHNHNGVYDINGAAESALTTAKDYTDSKIANLINNSTTAVDSIMELAAAMADNVDAIESLETIASNKANVSDLTSHTGNTTVHVTNEEKQSWNAKSNFSGNYNDLTNQPTIPSISGLATETYVDEAISTKADSSHSHGDLYYTETEMNSLLANKANSNHNHNSSYDVLGAANTALVSAKDYADEVIADEVANRDTAIATAKNSAISTASSDATTKANNALASAKSYTDTAVATVKNDLLNGAGTAYDTLKELGDLIDENVDAIEALEVVAAGKANTSHTHTIANITNLQSTLDGKAATSHGTHVSYSTTAPVMDGTASVGTATTVARSDHKHPTDTSRAAQTSLDSHTGNKSNPHGVTLTQLGLTATANELNVLDGITATVTELNYVDGVTSNIQTQLDGKAASGHTHSYAGSSSVGGAATSANKLNTNAGDVNTPVYFANGVPVPCTSLDLNTSGNAATATNVAWSGVTSKPSYYDAKAIKSITRSGTTFTYTCMDGTTGTFTQQDNNTTYSAVTTSANGLMIASDKLKLDGMVIATISEVETYLGI